MYIYEYLISMNLICLPFMVCSLNGNFVYFEITKIGINARVSQIRDCFRNTLV